MAVLEYLSAEYYASKDDLKQKTFWYDCLCEFMTTIILKVMVVFVMVSTNVEFYKQTTTHYGIFIAGFVFMMLETYGPIACYMNPMITYCMGLARRISIARAFAYMIIEVIGAIIGSYIGLMMTPATSRLFTPLFPATSLNYYESVAVEAFFSFNLVFVVLSCHGKEFYRTIPSLPNLAIAMALGVGLWAGGSHTGGYMNPIIPLASVLLSGDTRYHEIYWLGPFIGGPLGVAAFKYFAIKKASKHVDIRPSSSGAKGTSSKQAGL